MVAVNYSLVFGCLDRKGCLAATEESLWMKGASREIRVSVLMSFKEKMEINVMSNHL